jgi:predicted nucleic acid-binding protein
MRIIDASVIVKLCIEESGSVFAHAIMNSGEPLAAPNHALAEVGEVLARKVRSGQATFEQMLVSVHAAAAEIDFIDIIGLMPEAMSMSIETQLSVYDCLYVVAAVHMGTQLVTADGRMLKQLRASRYAQLLVPLDSSTGSP